MVDIDIGNNVKLRRLTVSERWAFVAGVLPIAAKSQIRGALMVGTVPADERDIAFQADVSVKTASSALEKLRHLGMLSTEEGVEVVHDWDDYQREPTKTTDKTAARRQALFRDKPLKNSIRERDGDNCRYGSIEVDWTDRRSAAGGTYDHIDPTGPNSLENLVVCCRGCNSQKGSRTPSRAGMELLPINSGSTPDLIRSTPDLKEVEVEGEVENHPPSPASGGDQRPRRKPAPPNPDIYPAELADDLRPVADDITATLQRVADAKGAKPISRAAVGRALVSYPNHDHTRLVGEFEHFWVHGNFASKPLRDVVAAYRNRVDSLPAPATPTTPTGQTASLVEIADAMNRHATRHVA